MTMRTTPAMARLDTPLAPGTPSRPGGTGASVGLVSGAVPAGSGSPQRGQSGRGPGATSPSRLLQYGHVAEGRVMELRAGAVEGASSPPASLRACGSIFQHSLFPK